MLSRRLRLLRLRHLLAALYTVWVAILIHNTASYKIGVQPATYGFVTGGRAVASGSARKKLAN